MIEHEILTESQKRAIAKIIGKCQNCGRKCIPEPHRINRGYACGKYTLKNIEWLGGKKDCGCHSGRHFREPMGRKG
jgi:hypothetical protein